ncbi:MAG: hypothetical protein R2991_14725 [Thermoanaerobaculia bacterium]
MTLEIEEVRSLRGFTVEWAAPDGFYLSRRNVVFHSRDLEVPFTPVAAIEAPVWRRAASASRLAQRLLRFMVTNVLPLANGDLFVTFDKTIGLIRDGRWLPLRGLSRPCRVLRGGCAVDPRGDVYFGEYLLNARRHDIGLCRYSPGSDSIERVHTFAAGEIAHVHGVYCDPHDGAMYCLTGDDAHECRILRSRDRWSSFEAVGQGDETWRAVSLQFSATHLLYGSDASFRANHLYRVDRATMRREAIAEVDSPVLYSVRLGDDYLFTTSAEKAPSQAADVASLWCLTPDGRCEKVVSLRKDPWHRSLFKLGALHLPGRSTLAHEGYFHAIGVVGDNRTFRLRRSSSGGMHRYGHDPDPRRQRHARAQAVPAASRP